MDEWIFFYELLVVPRLTYCSVIWSSHLKRDIQLRALKSLFLRMAVRRCGPSHLVDLFSSVSVSLHADANRRALRRIFAAGESDFYFVSSLNARRGLQLKPRTTARTDAVNNSFCYRKSSRTLYFKGIGRRSTDTFVNFEISSPCVFWQMDFRR